MEPQFPDPRGHLSPDRDSLANHSLPASPATPLTNGISDSNFEITFNAGRGGSVEMNVALLGPSGAPVGSVSLKAPALEDTRDVLMALVGAASKGSEIVPGAALLEQALYQAELDGLAYSSPLGSGPIGILAEYRDRYTDQLPASEIERCFSMKEVADNIFHLNFDTGYMMTSTFLRFQEHYESPEFRGKIFSLDEFKAWYPASRPHGEFSYYQDWGGFNVPSYILEPFQRGDFDPLSEKEKALLNCFSKLSGKYYVIGTYGANDAATLRHEVAHGLYYTNDAYRAEVDQVLDGLDLGEVEDHLQDLGYHQASWRDECHAYLGDDLEYLEDEGIDAEPFEDVHERLLEIYGRYMGGS